MKKTMMMLLMAALCLATVSGCTKKQSYEPDRKETVNGSPKEKQGSQKADTANDEKEDVAGSDSTDADSGRREESASEEPEYARLTYDGETLSAAVDAIYIDNDGNLAVQVKGMGGVFGGVLPIRNVEDKKGEPAL